jgi:chloramphenicol O-acetyltransferase type A
MKPVPIDLLAGPRASAFAFGRYTPEGSRRVMMSLHVEAHHALVDGLHVARFVQQLEAFVNQPDLLW